MCLFAGVAGGLIVSWDHRRHSSNRIIAGTFTIVDSTDGFSGGSCRGTGGYSDLGAGTSVSVFDAADRLIAVGSLGHGATADSATRSSRCTFPFVVVDVPDKPIYQIEVSHRGRVPFSRAEAAGVAMTIGS